MATLSYKDAGVDLDQYGQAMRKLPALMAATHGPRVLSPEGGFAGLFQLQGDGQTYEDPVLVSGTDGVGTKIRVAQLAGRFDTIGIDLVAMCVNDCLCVGAEPLFFLDYLALAQDDADLVAELVKGVSEGCRQAGAALLGGETAIMPGLYAPGDFDLAGFCVGVVERERVIDGSRIRPGDVLLGLPSSGLHSNGFSLVRKAVFEAGGLGIDDEVPRFDGTVADVLLTPTHIYANVVSRLLGDESVASSITGIAHITGGGLEENTARILPAGCRLSIDYDAWQVPAVFDWVRDLGNIEEDEMFRVFNMGIGMVIVVRSESAGAASELLNDRSTFAIGKVVEDVA